MIEKRIEMIDVIYFYLFCLNSFLIINQNKRINIDTRKIDKITLSLN